jgi:hypothetical protein
LSPKPAARLDLPAFDEPVGDELLVLDQDVLHGAALSPPAIRGKEGGRGGADGELHVRTECPREDHAGPARMRGRRDDDHATEPVAAGPARDRSRLRRGAGGATLHDAEGVRGDAERSERARLQLVLLGEEDALTPQRGRTARELWPGEEDDRGETGAIESRGLERAIGGRAGEHHDRIGVRRERVGDHQEPAGVKDRHHAERGEAGDEQESRAAHGAGSYGPASGRASQRAP